MDAKQKSQARKANTYRGERRNRAKRLKLIWRELEARHLGTGPNFAGRREVIGSWPVEGP